MTSTLSPKSPHLFCEVGLNHFGLEDYLEEYADAINTAAVSGLVLQVPEPAFFESEKYGYLKLPLDCHLSVVERVISSGKMCGVAIADVALIDAFESVNTDFYKVLSKDIENTELLTALVSTGKTLYVSTGMSDLDTIDSFANTMETHRDQLVLIHTQLSNRIEDCNLRSIKMLKERYNLPVAFGHHSECMEVMLTAIGLEPHAVFFYVRGGREGCICLYEQKN